MLHINLSSDNYRKNYKSFNKKITKPKVYKSNFFYKLFDSMAQILNSTLLYPFEKYMEKRLLKDLWIEWNRPQVD